MFPLYFIKFRFPKITNNQLENKIIYMTITSLKTLSNKILLYKQILRPLLTYRCPVYCSMAQTHYDKLQRTQHGCLRMILGHFRSAENAYKYSQTWGIDGQTNMPLIKGYILELSEKFYKHCLPEPLRETFLTSDWLSAQKSFSLQMTNLSNTPHDSRVYWNLKCQFTTSSGGFERVNDV